MLSSIVEEKKLAYVGFAEFLLVFQNQFSML